MEQVFPEAERRVFHYFNGVREVYADPMHIFRRLILAFDGNPNAILERLNADEPFVWASAVEQAIPGIRVAFEMAEFDPTTGAGATSADCLAALHAWQGWLAAKKEKAAS